MKSGILTKVSNIMCNISALSDRHCILLLFESNLHTSTYSHTSTINSHTSAVNTTLPPQLQHYYHILALFSTLPPLIPYPAVISYTYTINTIFCRYLPHFRHQYHILPSTPTLPPSIPYSALSPTHPPSIPRSAVNSYTSAINTLFSRYLPHFCHQYHILPLTPTLPPSIPYSALSPTLSPSILYSAIICHTSAINTIFCNYFPHFRHQYHILQLSSAIF